MDDDRVALNRRHFFAVLSAMGLAGTVLPDALVIAAQDAPTVTVEMIAAAQKHRRRDVHARGAGGDRRRA